MSDNEDQPVRWLESETIRKAMEQAFDDDEGEE